ncbi:MAG: TolC family protein [Robiginitomaculum sp.]|nr:TolC family protein [Robiginitomaculum sp.]
MTIRIFITFIVSVSGFSYAAIAQTPLSLEEGVTIALQSNDPSVGLLEKRALALEDRAVSDSQLPDPVFSTRIMSVPLSSFDINREGMTQLSLGVRQAFPKGQTRALTREKRLAEALVQRKTKVLRNREIALQTRTFWLELYYWRQARAITEQTLTKVEELGTISEANYASGKGGAQNVLRIDLEKSLLQTRLVDLDRKADMAKADLSRLIGIANAARPLDEQLPSLPQLPAADKMQAELIHHPSVKVYDAQLQAHDRQVDIANEQYKPGFAVDAAYGLRDSRSDFGSIGVSYSIPLFKKNRQDRVLSATKNLRGSTRLARDVQLLELNRALGRSFADWARLGESIALYENDVIDRAADTAEAALFAYENETADFAELVRAELAVLDAELTLIRLRVDRTKSHAKLMFLEWTKP